MITYWYKYNRNNKLEYNHAEDGFHYGKPEPKFDSQKSWARSEWVAEYHYLDGNVNKRYWETTIIGFETLMLFDFYILKRYNEIIDSSTNYRKLINKFNVKTDVLIGLSK